MKESTFRQAPTGYAGIKPFWMLLVAFTSVWFSGASAANTGAKNWVELVRACEAVILDQSFAALATYEEAPFSKGLPGIKEYSVYDRSRRLVAIARADKSEWVHCLVREREEARSRWRKLASEWVAVFEASFPKPQHSWATWINPNRPFRGATRCVQNGHALVIAPNLDTNFSFRVAVYIEKLRNPDWCQGDGGLSVKAAPPAQRVLPGPVWQKPKIIR